MRFLLIALVAIAGARQLMARTTDNSFIALAKPFPVVGYLEKRGKIITFKAGGEGPIVTVEEKGGKILAEDVTQAELLKKNPELYKLVKAAIAEEDPGLFIDASAGPKPSGRAIPWQLPAQKKD